MNDLSDLEMKACETREIIWLRVCVFNTTEMFDEFLFKVYFFSPILLIFDE